MIWERELQTAKALERQTKNTVLSSNNFSKRHDEFEVEVLAESGESRGVCQNGEPPRKEDLETGRSVKELGRTPVRVAGVEDREDKNSLKNKQK